MITLIIMIILVSSILRPRYYGWYGHRCYHFNPMFGFRIPRYHRPPMGYRFRRF